MSLSVKVGVDARSFRPWHFEEINLLMTEKAKARIWRRAGGSTLWTRRLW